MATEFICTLKSTGGDFTKPSLWVDAVKCSLASTTKVFSVSAAVGTLTPNSSVTGSSSGATGTIVLLNVAEDQILIDGITGTFTSGENIEIDGSNYVTISDGGDTAICVLKGDAGTYAETTKCNIDGWTNTSATNFARFINADGVATGDPSGGVYVTGAVNTAGALEINDNYVEVIGIRIKNNGAGGLSARGLVAIADYYLVDQCIVSSGANVNSYAVFASIAGVTNNPQIRNTLVLQATAEAFFIKNYYDGVIYNCGSVASGTYGFYKEGTNKTTTVTNCYSLNATTADVGGPGWSAAVTKSKIATADATGTITGLDSGDFDDYAGADYHPATGGLIEDGDGDDLSGTFTDDIEGSDRGTSFSIGPYASAAGTVDALTADDLQSTSNVTQPVVGQVHALTADDLQSTSNVTQPVVGQVHALTADDLQSTSEVTSPTIAESVHVLTADDLESASNVTQPVVGQVHALTADDLQSTSEVTSPTLAEATDILTADDLQSTSEVTSPVVGQVHALTADDLQSTSEVTSPTLAEATDELTADDLESASEVTSPVVGQVHALTADDLQSTSEVTSPVVGQVHVIAANDLESASEVTSPTVSEGAFSLLGDDLESASEVTQPVLGQVHIILAADLQSLSQVSIGQMGGWSEIDCSQTPNWTVISC